MQFSAFTAAMLLPLVAYAQSTSTLIATRTMTVTISEVVATETASYSSHNSTMVFATGTGASSGIVASTSAIMSPIVSVTGTGALTASTGTTNVAYATGAASLNAANVGSAVAAALAIIALF